MSKGRKLLPRKARREVALFARYMEHKLRANDHRGTWKLMKDSYLFGGLFSSARALQVALDVNSSARLVSKEAGDVANWAMMIADNYQRRSRRKS